MLVLSKNVDEQYIPLFRAQPSLGYSNEQAQRLGRGTDSARTGPACRRVRMMRASDVEIRRGADRAAPWSHRHRAGAGPRRLDPCSDAQSRRRRTRPGAGGL